MSSKRIYDHVEEKKVLAGGLSHSVTSTLNALPCKHSESSFTFNTLFCRENSDRFWEKHLCLSYKKNKSVFYLAPCSLPFPLRGELKRVI